VAAGANYVARWTSYHVKELTKAITTGMQTPGLAFIEVRTQCPTNFGRHNKLRRVPDMIEYLRSHAMLVSKYDRLLEEGAEIPEGTFSVGELIRRKRPAMGVKQ